MRRKRSNFHKGTVMGKIGVGAVAEGGHKEGEKGAEERRHDNL